MLLSPSPKASTVGESFIGGGYDSPSCLCEVTVKQGVETTEDKIGFRVADFLFLIS